MNQQMKMELALEALLLAYAKSDEEFGCPGVDWEDLDFAFEQAREVMPDVYERLVNQIAAERGEEDEEIRE